MFALIHQPVQNAMQSGVGNSTMWVLDFASKSGQQQIDPLTGTVGTTDVMGEVQLNFDTKEQAIAYAKSHNIPYRLIQRSRHIPVGRSYGDNFAFDRKFPWTH
ncbi:MAG TPA: ETC complex I subunit [Hellea balneolensis]|uniref:ETC complex I subunit n=1 Tax=Hellea balneolensis TaxID=287478 RepID=A0A7C3C595_9PROT|nr:ETC complex I subunit [Hellea balneolensis]